MTPKSILTEPDHRPVGLPAGTMKSELTLSEVGEPVRQGDETPAYGRIIEMLLAEIDSAPDYDTHIAAVDRLIDYIWPGTPPLTESEMRYAWGDR